MPKDNLPSPESESALRRAARASEVTREIPASELPGERPAPVERHRISVVREVADLKEHASELEQAETPEQLEALLEVKNIPDSDFAIKEIEARAAKVDEKFETALADRTIFEWKKAQQLAAELDAVYDIEHGDAPEEAKELRAFMKQDHYQHWLERMGAQQVEKDFSSLADAEASANRAFEDPLDAKETTTYEPNIELRKSFHEQMPPEIKELWDQLPERVVRRLPELIKEKNPEAQRQLLKDIRSDEIELFRPWLDQLPEEQKPEARRYITEYVWYFVGHKEKSIR
jgi:hypothetical protein